MKLFVVGFDNSVTLVDLLMLFQEFGDVEAIRMKQGEKRRYALIEMGAYDGERAIKQLDGKNWNGTRLAVSESMY